MNGRKLKGGGLASLFLVVALTMSLTPCVAFAEGTTGDTTGGGTGSASGIQPINDESTDVAEVNGTVYTTLQDALVAASTAAQAGQEVKIKLLADVAGTETAGIEIPEGMTVALDLAGHALVGKNAGSWIVNRGSLTVDDSVGAGRVYTTNTDAQGRHAVVNYGTLVINGGTFGDANVDKVDANSVQRGNALRNYGTATINGGFFTACDNYTNGGYAYAIANGGSEDYPNASLTINDATVYGKTNGAIASDGGTLTVKGGTYSLGSGLETNLFHMVYASGAGVVDIEGGSFTRNVDNQYGFLYVDGEDSEINVSGGTYKDTKDNQNVIVGGSGTVTVFEKQGVATPSFDGISKGNNATVQISGGVFESNVTDSDLIVSGYEPKEVTASDGKTVYVVVGSSEVASIGDMQYEKLQDAIDAVAEGGATGTIVLKKNVLESVAIPANANVTLDLNGKTITNVAGYHTITNNGTLIVTDSGAGVAGTVDNVSHTKAAVFNDEGATCTVLAGCFTRSQEAGTYDSGTGKTNANGNSYYAVENFGTMTFGSDDEGAGNSRIAVTAIGGHSSLVHNGWQSSGDAQGKTATMTINGGAFTGGINTIKNDEGGDLTINGGTFDNVTQYALMNWNVATINGGTFESATSAVFNGSEASTSVGKLSITGGMFKADSRYYVVYSHRSETSDPTTKISGGTFSSQYICNDEPTDYCADGFEPAENADGTYTVKREASPVAPTKPSYAVTVEQVEGGSVSVSPASAKAGDKVTVTVTPEAGQELVDLVVADASGNEVELTENADGTYSFTMPSGKVTVSATFECDGGVLCPSARFTDVDQSQWYHLVIDWAVEEGILNGYDGTTLMGPDNAVTRAQMTTILYNAENAQPGDVSALSAYADVDASAWYVGSLAWAVEQGLLEGWSDNGTSYINPDGELTREQAAAVLMRWAESKGADTSARADLASYPDVASVSEWAEGCMSWAVAEGVINGVEHPDGTRTLDAQGTTNRAQMAALLMNLIEG